MAILCICKTKKCIPLDAASAVIAVVTMMRFALLCLLSIAVLDIGFLLSLFRQTCPCETTYMYKSYLHVLQRKDRRYHLYRYHEQRIPGGRQEPRGGAMAVLFLPGSAGNYEQVRAAETPRSVFDAWGHRSVRWHRNLLGHFSDVQWIGFLIWNGILWTSVESIRHSKPRSLSPFYTCCQKARCSLLC